jgi:hypothetical protein
LIIRSRCQFCEQQVSCQPGDPKRYDELGGEALIEMIRLLIVKNERLRDENE